VLAAHGTGAIKGAPETFDPAGFVALLRRILAVPRDTVFAPAFDRSLEEPIGGAVEVGPDVDIVITEGNYLLLPQSPWGELAEVLDEIWFLDVEEPERLRRLISRHVEFGRAVDVATERATTGSDGDNAALVLSTAARADLLVVPR
jgi:pantothenate kinase